MRACLLCKNTYPDEVDVCPMDGSALEAPVARLDATASIAPPGGAMLPFASIEPGPTARNRPRGSGRLRAVEDDGEKTRQDRPPRRPPPVPADVPGPVRPQRAIGDTSELEKPGRSMLLSSDPEAAPMPPPESRIGHVVGSYRLLEIIGRGGMGCVYRAEHVKLGRDVALKLLREDYAQRRDAVARFFQEARAVNLIRHRNIVDVIDYVELDDHTVFIIMELLAGQSLGRLMRGSIQMGRALSILAQICDGLSAAHAVGIVHRDLKPDNIIVVRSNDGGDLVKILDFGVAKLVDKVSSNQDLTAVGSVIGTPAYMSPEQAGGLSVDGRSDVYSLGAIMYELFTREPLFRGSSFREFVHRHMHQEPVRPSDLPGCERIDPRLEEIILRCLAKSPSARYQSALELRASLVALLASLETQLPPETATGGALSWAVPPAVARAGEPIESDTERAERFDVASLDLHPSALERSASARPSAAGLSAEWGPPGSTPLPEPVAFGTPTPYGPPTPDVIRPSGRIVFNTPQPVASEPVPEKAPERIPARAAPAPVREMPTPARANPNPVREMPTPARPSGQRAARAEPVPTPRSSRVSARSTESSQRAAARPSVRPVETGKSSPRAGRSPARAVESPEPRSKLGIGLGVAIVLTAGAVAFFIPFLARSPDEDALAAAVPAPTAPTASADAPAPGSTATAATDAPAPGPAAATNPADPAATADPAPVDPAAAGSEPADSEPADTESADSRRSRTRSSSRQADPRRAAPGRETAVLVRVRIVSTPPGRLHSAGGGALCETPCAITINPADGGSAESRSYVIKRPGYRDETITIDLASPPAQLQVDLKKLRPAPGDGDNDADSTFNPFGEPEAGEAGNE